MENTENLPAKSTTTQDKSEPSVMSAFLSLEEPSLETPDLNEEEFKPYTFYVPESYLPILHRVVRAGQIYLQTDKNFPVIEMMVAELMTSLPNEVWDYIEDEG